MAAKKMYARAYCIMCKLLLQAQCDGRKPVGIECQKCKRYCYIHGTSKYPLSGAVVGYGIYLDWGEKK
jgi:hypothetical protein